MQQENGQQIQIKISEEVQKGLYANAAQITHTAEEFALDFLNIFPPGGVVNARIFMSPGHVKRFADTLVDVIKKYETQFGAITLSESPQPKIGYKTE